MGDREKNESNKTVAAVSGQSCWNCKYQNLTAQDTFLGVCTWFQNHGLQNKQIPPDVVDVGCKHFEPR